MACPGWSDGILGMLLGFACLILPYLWGGMGAGDVKALAALGAWLGPKLTVFLFCYMGIAGGVIAVGYLVWQGSLWEKIKQGWTLPAQSDPVPAGRPPRPPSPDRLTDGIPYGVAIAVGMLILVGSRGYAVIPGSVSGGQPSRRLEGTGLVELASAARLATGGKISLVRISCRIKMDPASPFTEVGPISVFRP